MNSVKTQRNHVRHKWHWDRQNFVECPHCKQVIQVQPARPIKLHRLNRVPLENRTYRHQRTRKTDVIVWQESHDSEPRYYEELTQRQAELLDVLVEGAPTNEQIAAKLGISRHTVEKHLSDIYQRLGVTSRYEAIVWSLNNRKKGV